jgi:phosphoribosylanthranilate isomerase
LYKLLGIKTVEEAMMVAKCGADFLGHPLVLDYHEPDLTIEELKDLIDKVCGVEHVLITYQSAADEILALMDSLPLNWVQLHGEINPEEVAGISLSGKKIIKSLIVRNDDLDAILSEAKKYCEFVDYFLLDTYDPATGASGATSKTHDWKLSRRLVESIDKPIILAGGLNPENLEESIQLVGPAGVDAHTGLEDKLGFKDYTKVKRFVEIAKKS